MDVELARTKGNVKIIVQHPKQDIRSYQRPTSHARSLSYQVEEEARVQRREEIELIACSCIRNV
jgi:hypothetical protein